MEELKNLISSELDEQAQNKKTKKALEDEGERKTTKKEPHRWDNKSGHTVALLEGGWRVAWVARLKIVFVCCFDFIFLVARTYKQRGETR